MKAINLLAVALLVSAGAFAQSKPTASVPTDQHGHGNRTPAQRAELRAERKAKFDKMTPDERKAFRETHRAQRQARLAAMPADKRAKFVDRKQVRKTQRKVEKTK